MMDQRERGLLEAGIYTIPEAADLVATPARNVRVWVGGHKGKQEPIIETDLGRADGKVAISFANLMELRFVAFFTQANVRLPEIRRIMSEARRILNHPHPFATKVVFMTDGRKIVAAIAKESGVENIYDLRSRNYEMHPVVMKSLMHDVVFDPDGEAIEWRPRPKIAPNVIVHPSFSFGQPILKGSNIPTSTVAQSVKTEGSVSFVATIFELSERQVREAVKFEQHLRRAA